MKLAGNCAIVTGGGSGIGQTIALRFASEGAKVLILDIDADGAESTVTRAKDRGGFANFLRTDVAKTADVNNAVEFAKSTLGKVDILVNNAGIPSFHRLIDTPEEEWD